MDALETRILALEDRLAIYQLIAVYGPAADAGDTEGVVGLWTEDGSYEIDGVGSFTGEEQLAELFTSELHQGYIHQGSAHVMSLPLVQVTGDTAVATNYAHLFLRDGEGFIVMRSVASRWELVRTESGWRVQRRVNALLDGSASSRALLGEGAKEALETSSD